MPVTGHDPYHKRCSSGQQRPAASPRLRFTAPPPGRHRDDTPLEYQVIMRRTMNDRRLASVGAACVASRSLVSSGGCGLDERALEESVQAPMLRARARW
jgi:hypothetical protein